MNIGLLTGGGDCSSLNAAIRGVAKTLIHSHKAKIIGIEDGFLGLIEHRTRILHESDLEGLIQQGGTILGTCNRASPKNFKGKDVRQDVLAYYKELNLDCIVALGGDGTMSMCHEMSELGMSFVGIPKTIDNDLMHTDRTFGFDTAVSIVTEAVDRLQTTGRSHHRVMIVETMGRYAGWVALYGGVAGDADIILIPEFPFHVDDVINTVEKRTQENGHSVIVIAEGATTINGLQCVSKTVDGSPDPCRLGGIGQWLQNEIEKNLDVECRTTVLGHTQRGGVPTAFDRIFATNLGCYAATLVDQKKYGEMVCVKNNQLCSVPLADVANKIRTVELNDMTLLTALESGVHFGVQGLHEQALEVLKEQPVHLR